MPALGRRLVLAGFSQICCWDLTLCWLKGSGQKVKCGIDSCSIELFQTPGTFSRFEFGRLRGSNTHSFRHKKKCKLSYNAAGCNLSVRYSERVRKLSQIYVNRIYSKHYTLTQYWFNGGPVLTTPSPKLIWHCVNVLFLFHFMNVNI